MIKVIESKPILNKLITNSWLLCQCIPSNVCCGITHWVFSNFLVVKVGLVIVQGLNCCMKVILTFESLSWPNLIFKVAWMKNKNWRGQVYSYRFFWWSSNKMDSSFVQTWPIFQAHSYSCCLLCICVGCCWYIGYFAWSKKRHVIPGIHTGLYILFVAGCCIFIYVDTFSDYTYVSTDFLAV